MDKDVKMGAGTCYCAVGFVCVHRVGSVAQFKGERTYMKGQTKITIERKVRREHKREECSKGDGDPGSNKKSKTSKVKRSKRLCCCQGQVSEDPGSNKTSKTS